MSERNLSSQFSHLLDTAHERLGMDLSSAPGMARVGGLHVPVTGGGITTYSTDEYDDSKNDELHLQVPDEMGNLYHISSYPHSQNEPYDTGYGSSFHGWVARSAPEPDNSHLRKFNSPEEFASIYGNVGAPTAAAAAYNSHMMGDESKIRSLMGARPGMLVANNVSNMRGTPESYLFDAPSRELTVPKIGYFDAGYQVDEENRRRREQGR